MNEFGLNIKNAFGAVGDGITDDSTALDMAFTATSSDIIIFPNGRYLIGKSITVPTNKLLLFSVGAVLLPVNGVTITINGSWEASPHFQIFDLSLSGGISGDFKVSEIYPEWLGAKGDGVSDDAKSFNDAMIMCDKKRVLRLGAKKYKLRSTVHNYSRGIRGVARYTDSGNNGTSLEWDPIDTATDLNPCIRIETSGHGSEFVDFAIRGRIGYNSKALATWINKEYYEQDDYRMFANGYSGIEIAGAATPIFRNVQVSQCKVGLMLNSTKGHITSYDSTWAGLIGVYCRLNSGDYFFQGGGINGAFCGVMLGITLEANHYGGMGVTMKRVHMGFSPYGFYQCKDAPMVNYDALQTVSGLVGNLISTRFERVGEAAIKLLPKAISEGLSISGFGFTWSPIEYTAHTGGWECPIPDQLLPRDLKQKYAMYLGVVRKGIDFRDVDAGGLFKSNAPGALGSVYIDILDADANLSGVQIENVVVRRKIPSVYTGFSTPQMVGNTIRQKYLNPLAAGNLMKNPEEASSWSMTGVGTGYISVITEAELPVPLSSEVRESLGKGPFKIIKVTPDGTNAQTVNLYALSNPLTIDPGCPLSYEYFLLSHKTSVRSRIVITGGTLYDHTYRNTPDEWYRISGRGQSSADIHRIEIGQSATDPMFIIGVMVTNSDLAPYSPYPHLYSALPIESRNGFIVSSPSGQRFKITVDDAGNLFTIVTS
ncbi:glycosyl hydrolase family 28-related protein [Paenibacillus glucanolyticus]|uniref:glycosyl hydrolase family 28-related protein n=1 Tax=Paenibacillus glucanolyticus TaxID=59843 RepID=UPI00096E2A33|nr:glycosyl hydrolase family 28-related protein [Paenibacillus glucanolyticus]OMF76070.1 hypothetical protein BK142_16375 [Paenibacillus glucanolyticus]